MNIKSLSVFMLFLFILFSSAYASGWHYADEIIDGEFSGDYNYTGIVDFTYATIIGLAGSGDITGVSAGTGLNGGGATGDVTLNIDSAYVQRRVTASCGTNQSIQGINEDGSVVCVYVNESASGSGSESDPVYLASDAAGITSGNISDWNDAYGWGDHSTEGYLTSYTEIDPQVGVLTNGKWCRSDGTEIICDVDTVAGASDVWINESGDSMSGTLNLNSQTALVFENGDHRITYNDGGGNFNIRAGNYYTGGHLYSDTGAGAIQVRLDHETTSPSFSVYISEDSANAVAGNPVTWEGIYTFSNAGSITANGNKVWHAGNDGTGSGLDADTLDGYESGSFLKVSANEIYVKDTRDDGDVLPVNFTSSHVAFTFTDEIVGSPNVWDAVLTMKGWGGSGYRAWQLLSGAGNGIGDDNLHFRTGADSSWGNLRTIWDSGNDGAGSGLDADTIDGMNSSSFLTSITGAWVNESGDTMTGFLQMDGTSFLLARPETTGGWARGLSYYASNTYSGTEWGGIGMFGANETVNNMYMAHGDEPWSSGYGIYILPNGNTGIGVVNPSERLSVNGNGYFRQATGPTGIEIRNNDLSDNYIDFASDDADDYGVRINYTTDGGASWLNIDGAVTTTFTDTKMGLNPCIKLDVSAGDDAELCSGFMAGSTLTLASNIRFNSQGVSYIDGDNFGVGTKTPSSLLQIGEEDVDTSNVYGAVMSLGSRAVAEGGEIHLYTAADSDDTYNYYAIDAYNDDLRIRRESVGNDITLTSEGKVGIGNVVPVARLHLGDTTNLLGTTAGDSLEMLRLQTETVNNDYLKFTNIRTEDGSDWYSARYRIQRMVDASNMGYIQFGDFGSDLLTFGYNNAEYMRLQGDGYLGLGTSSPSVKLDVVSDDTYAYVKDGTGLLGRNYVNSHDWDVGSGGTPMFPSNGFDTENSREWGIGPHGNRVILWKATPDVDYNADGGWNGDFFPINHTKTYRYTVWIKRSVSQDGVSYFGTHGGGMPVTTLAGVSAPNPYFWNGDFPELDKWYLLVGYVHGSGDNSTVSYGGVYDGETGEKVYSATDYKFNTSTTQTHHRAYLYYSTAGDGNEQYFWDPRVEEVTGFEPTVEALLGLDKGSTQGVDRYFGGNVNVSSGKDVCIEGGNCLSSVGGATLPSCSDGEVLKYNGTSSNWECETESGSGWKLMHVQDQKTSGTNGGDSVAGDNQRDLNTVLINEIDGAYLGTNNVTLPAGEYWVEVESAVRPGQYDTAVYSKIVLSNGSSYRGTNIYNHDSGFPGAMWSVHSRKKIILDSSMEVSVYTVHENAAGSGLGLAYNIDSSEVYTDLQIWKIDSSGFGLGLPTCFEGEVLQMVSGSWTCVDGSGIGSGGGWTHNGTQVFSAVAPTSYTDLDLSSIVGTSKTLVMLRVQNNGGTNCHYSFRTNGETYLHTTGVSHGSDWTVTGGYTSNFIVETDENGAVEWKGDSTQSTNIELVGYISSSSSVIIEGKNWKLMHVQDQKTSGTHGGASVAGWNDRVLNTVLTNEITGASLSSNQITLPAGEYYVEAEAPGYYTAENRLSIYDVDNTLNLLSGTNVRTGTAYSQGGMYAVSGKITLDSETTIKLRHYTTAAVASVGLGRALSMGDEEVYGNLRIWKIEEGEGASSAVPYMPGYIYGLEYAQDGTDPDKDVTVSTGYARDAANSVNLDLVSAMTKQLDATWAVGDNAGGLFSGSVAADTMYHIFVIKNPTTGVVDVGFDTDGDATNRPSGYTKYRWVGYIRTDSSANIEDFAFNDDVLTFANEQLIVSGFTSTSYTFQSLTSVVPAGRGASALLYTYNAGATKSGVIVSAAQSNIGEVGNSISNGYGGREDEYAQMINDGLYMKVGASSFNIYLMSVKLKR